ncbi:hypothetical protein BDV96DRAFT_601855 [Lophiotrema nucula]|uniref:Uncharacterized protein n=1 Tax=Lophiotrema nucula TaxID=690887 RepID=A0A6A5Z0U7_9PLEO|nr:hypothetical protein BDV96DRAFT_601855 [Lophiotrema nucula]
MWQPLTDSPDHNGSKGLSGKSPEVGQSQSQIPSTLVGNGDGTQADEAGGRWSAHSRELYGNARPLSVGEQERMPTALSSSRVGWKRTRLTNLTARGPRLLPEVAYHSTPRERGRGRGRGRSQGVSIAGGNSVLHACCSVVRAAPASTSARSGAGAGAGAGGSRAGARLGDAELLLTVATAGWVLESGQLAAATGAVERVPRWERVYCNAVPVRPRSAQLSRRPSQRHLHSLSILHPRREPRPAFPSRAAQAHTGPGPTRPRSRSRPRGSPPSRARRHSSCSSCCLVGCPGHTRACA